MRATSEAGDVPDPDAATEPSPDPDDFDGSDTPDPDATTGSTATPPPAGIRAAPSDDPVLPDRAWEDDDRAWGSGAGREAEDEHYLRDVPPHWS